MRTTTTPPDLRLPERSSSVREGDADLGHGAGWWARRVVDEGLLFALHEDAVALASPGCGEDGEAAVVGAKAGVGRVVEREFALPLPLLSLLFLAVGAEEEEGAEEEGAGSDDGNECDEEVDYDGCEAVVGGGVVAAEQVDDGFHCLASFF